MTRLVMGEGPANAKIVIIGEAPGEHEHKLGRPFVGPAGSLLNTLLHGSGIVRTDCYLTNVVKERPPGNDIKKFISFYRGEGRPTAEYKQYEAALYEELKVLQPNVIVPVGNVSLWAVCRRHGITNWRGSILESVPEIGRVKVIPTIHPASALRTYEYKWYIAKDLTRIKHEAETPDINLPVRDIKIGKVYEEVMEYLQSARLAGQPVGFDIEVPRRTEMTCFAIAKSPEDVMCIPLEHGIEQYWSSEHELDIMDELAALLEDPEVPIVIQNAMYDSYFMYYKYGILTANIEDTMIAHKILYPEFPKGLHFITSTYTREPYFKAEGKSKWEDPTRTIDNEVFWRYNAKDSAVTLEAWPKLERDLRRMGNYETYRNVIRLLEPLQLMQYTGVRVDTDAIKLATQEIDRQVEDLQSKLAAIAGKEINVNSPKQVAGYFYIDLGLPPYKSRKRSGGVSVDETALKRIARKGYEEASLILEIRGLLKMRNTYLEMKLDADNRIRGSFDACGAETGRLSCRKTIFDTGGNMQNIPPEMSFYLKADPDYLICGPDLKQAENRVVANIAPDHNMILAFEEGMDIHRLTASMIFRKPYEEVSDEDGSAPIGSGRFSERFWGKKANHGLNYGESPNMFSLINEISLDEARFIHASYMRSYPGVVNYHKWVREKLRSDRTLENPFGRKRKFYGRLDSNPYSDTYKQAYSHIPQSTVAEMVHYWGDILIYYDDLFKHAVLLNDVHDAVYFQINLTHGWQYYLDCVVRLKESLEQPLYWKGRSFFIPVDIKVGLNMRDLVKVGELTVDGLREAYHEAKGLEKDGKKTR